MPLVDGRDISPDEAIHRGLCPECAAAITPRTALTHARSHWNPDRPDLSEEARRRLNLLAEFAKATRIPSQAKSTSPDRPSEPPSSALTRDIIYDLFALPFAF